MRTYIDSCVLIAAFRGNDKCHEFARQILDDPDREFVVSQYVELEVIPKPTFQKKHTEAEFMRTAIEAFTERVQSTSDISALAIAIASEFDVSGIDALHVAAALISHVDEFVTTEKIEKPMFRVKGMAFRSLHPTC